jgi:AcrR family transcriptional regulator
MVLYRGMMTSGTQRVGRPRDSRVDHAILAATRELLVELGYAALTMDAVAAKARIGKAAIYRRYATKQEMVFAAAVHGSTLQVPAATGSLRDDLTLLIGDIVASLSGPVTAAAMPGLFAELTTDPTLAARFAETFIAAERAYISEVLDRAVRRGELAHRPDLELVHALLLGPVFAWLFMFGKPADPDLPATLARLVVDGFSSNGTRS